MGASLVTCDGDWLVQAGERRGS